MAYLSESCQTFGMANTEKLPILHDFGAMVRAYRMERGLSQEAFADACEIDRSYMGGVERGERNLALVNIVRIIQALDMEPSVGWTRTSGTTGGRRNRQKRSAKSCCASRMGKSRSVQPERSKPWGQFRRKIFRPPDPQRFRPSDGRPSPPFFPFFLVFF